MIKEEYLSLDEFLKEVKRLSIDKIFFLSEDRDKDMLKGKEVVLQVESVGMLSAYHNDRLMVHNFLLLDKSYTERTNEIQEDLKLSKSNLMTKIQTICHTDLVIVRGILSVVK